ncbi:hypothetical protein HDU80_001513, partial [Chytriomyces hyalinus]
MRQNAAAQDVMRMHAPEAAVDAYSQAGALQTSSSTDILPLTWDNEFGGLNSGALVDMFGHWDAGLLEAFRHTCAGDSEGSKETAETPAAVRAVCAVPAGDI